LGFCHYRSLWVLVNIQFSSLSSHRRAALPDKEQTLNPVVLESIPGHGDSSSIHDKKKSIHDKRILHPSIHDKRKWHAMRAITKGRKNSKSKDNNYRNSWNKGKL